MPVNRAPKGNWPGSNHDTQALADPEILVFTPSMLASVDIKPTQIGWHRQSRTGLYPPCGRQSGRPKPPEIL